MLPTTFPGRFNSASFIAGRRKASSQAMTVDPFVCTPTCCSFSPYMEEVRAGPPPPLLNYPPPASVRLPPFHAQPSLLREEANKTADDLGRLLRRYEGLIAERTRLKLFPGYDTGRHRSTYRPYNVRNTSSQMSYLNREIRSVEAYIWSARSDLGSIESDVDKYLAQYRLCRDLYQEVKTHIYCLKWTLETAHYRFEFPVSWYSN